ncbi:MAG TPA: glycosyltransferase [Candidatus Limnocylindria bacterium]|nr:glycosyltransferase [Candidatus Limnocylindria bacterium]
MATGISSARVRVDGRFFRLGESKFHPKGVTYGPFAPNAAGERFATREQTIKDFVQIKELGANTLRIYHVPPHWFLDLAREHELKLLIDIPWHKERCFLDARNLRLDAKNAVRDAVALCARHPAVFAFSVVNEIPSDIVRWSGARRVAEFIEELVEEAKAIDPDCLCTFGNFPPTEFLRPENIDFLCFNIYLHQRRAFENYLARLQMIADTKPLIVGETGIDSLREGEEHKCEILSWQIEAGFQRGLAGMFIFSFTDDWYRNDAQVEDWTLGLTDRSRKAKASFFAVQRAFKVAPYFPLARYPRVSVVVASYNGAKTLETCLASLERLNYPDYEIILIDDGSTDSTCRIAAEHPRVHYIFQPNKGLSVARNTGINAATGEVVAFTDSDCRADEDWLHYLMGDLLSSDFAGVGGHNFLPPEDSWIAAAVMVSPGGPAHVMLNDREAEHIPGCNMAFYKWALDQIGGFDPIYRKAGDDVDVCWRLQQAGYRIGFSPAGFVWHYRRSTVKAYLKQQVGYGEAEALLMTKHPEYFNPAGASVWRGRIYSPSSMGIVVRRSVIYHGPFAGGWFQTLYAPPPAFALMLATALEFHVLVTLPLIVLSVPFQFLWPLSIASLCLSLSVCVAAASQAQLAKNKQRFWSRPLVSLLCFLQPMARGWARYEGRLRINTTPSHAFRRIASLAYIDRGEPLDEVQYWCHTGLERVSFVQAAVQKLEQEGWQHKPDTGWEEFDVEIYGTRWSRLQLSTVAEAVEKGHYLFHCRLNTGWSLLAKVLFWSACGLQLLLIGLVADAIPWLWMLLLTLPLLGLYFEHEKRILQRLIVAFLDELAEKYELTKVPFEKMNSPTPVAKTGPPLPAPIFKP